ncbi:MAG TPA: hypothetical protein VJT54_06745, partial [Verrucomicrobiae bacterium]|nr:hypothetical protein [Verrucomicrobiae bacterium]
MRVEIGTFEEISPDKNGWYVVGLRKDFDGGFIPQECLVQGYNQTVKGNLFSSLEFPGNPAQRQK